MAQSLPHRVKNLLTGVTPAITRPPTGPVETPDDIDGRLDLTGPLSIVARRRLGESDLTVHPVALGAREFGTSVEDEVARRILDRYVALGGNLIDTADSAGQGASETVIGAWLRERGMRDTVVLSTKVGRHADASGLGPVSIVRAVEASLARLGTDHIDLLYLDGEDAQVPLDESLSTVEWLIETGKVRWLAATGFSAERLMEARILASTGLPRLVAVQSPYNLMHRTEFESGLRIVASAQGLAVMPQAALAHGYLSGAFRSRADLGQASPASAAAGQYLGRRGSRVLAALDRVAAELDTTVTSVALAWLLAKRAVVSPVVTVRAPGQVDSLVLAASIRLTRSQMRELDRVSE
ncbi:aldo/keto reductase [Microbacterium sp. STN6]|uniref:aldo/keto reductase n=1 Tax=Microbacterium sp. STN6 TaxID=2995588 RepID=UPI002260DAEF|nr:aldo/keto reductase [Microbacterium sp. STN6]MCX7521291.1 aldo/keto reductase [Microbacterium sp. STN6]